MQKTFWNKSKKTHKDKQYLSWVHQTQNCLVCSSSRIELHHIKHWNITGRDDRYILPLCYLHHRGSEFSPHGSPKEWEEKYPIEQQIEIADSYYQSYKSKI